MKLDIAGARKSQRILCVSNYCAIALGSSDLVEAFHEWAFGKEAMGRDLKEYPAFWNDKHSDLFVVKPSDDILDTLDKMMKSFIEITIEKSS